MPLATKVLWIVNMNADAMETAFSKHALAIGATTVCMTRQSAARSREVRLRILWCA